MLSPDRLSDIRLSFGRHAFDEFVGFGLRRRYSDVQPLSDLPLRCYDRREMTSFGGQRLIYVVDDMPVEPFGESGLRPIPRAKVVETLEHLRTLDIPYDAGEFAHGFGFAFMTGLSGIPEQVLQTTVAAQYAHALRVTGFSDVQMLVGSIDTILRDPIGRAALGEFVQRYADGLAIDVGGALQVEPFVITRIVNSGVTRSSRVPLEPVRPVRGHDVLNDFERLLAGNPKESLIEEFLRTHYRDVFGFKYDRIATQVWLRLPEADVGRRNRRTDLLMRNAVTQDWELVELKRADVKLTGSSRDIPMLSRQVRAALDQANNYQRLLRQDAVRQILAREGIEYFEPTARVVIGRTPTISRQHWRYLCAEHPTQPALLTYDDLLLELRYRASQDDLLWP